MVPMGECEPEKVQFIDVDIKWHCTCWADLWDKTGVTTRLQVAKIGTMSRGYIMMAGRFRSRENRPRVHQLQIPSW